MNSFRSGKLRLLYLLALAQLLGGPLVLLQVTIFCKSVAQELPNRGLTTAFVEAWDSSCAVTDELVSGHGSSRLPLSREKKAPKKCLLVKPALQSWDVSEFQSVIPCLALSGVLYERVWTPVWPQAPPGPPPRVG